MGCRAEAGTLSSPKPGAFGDAAASSPQADNGRDGTSDNINGGNGNPGLPGKNGQNAGSIEVYLQAADTRAGFYANGGFGSWGQREAAARGLVSVGSSHAVS